MKHPLLNHFLMRQNYTFSSILDPLSILPLKKAVSNPSLKQPYAHSSKTKTFIFVDRRLGNINEIKNIHTIYASERIQD